MHDSAKAPFHSKAESILERGIVGLKNIKVHTFVACRTGVIFLRFSGERGQAQGERTRATGGA